MIDRLRRIFEPKLVICAVISLCAHFVFARGLEQLPPRELTKLPVRITVTVVAPPPVPPPPEPPKPPEPPPPPPKIEPLKVVHERPRSKPTPAVAVTAPPETVAPVTTAPTTGDPAARPVFGVTLESTSQGGKTTVAVGNTTQPQPTGPATPGEVKPLVVAPAAAAEVTKMPIPQGRCSGKYTEAARTAAIEGVVVLDLIVDERGRTRDIVVVSGLAHGLTEAAIAALRACQFTPGEKAGVHVPVRVRGFKIRFVLE